MRSGQCSNASWRLGRTHFNSTRREAAAAAATTTVTKRSAARDGSPAVSQERVATHHVTHCSGKTNPFFAQLVIVSAHVQHQNVPPCDNFVASGFPLSQCARHFESFSRCDRLRDRAPDAVQNWEMFLWARVTTMGAGHANLQTQTPLHKSNEAQTRPSMHGTKKGQDNTVSRAQSNQAMRGARKG